MSRSTLRRISIYSMVLALLITACATQTTPPDIEAITTIAAPTQPACTTLAIQPTPGPDNSSVIPPVAANDHTRGNEDALITLMDYSDFQDPRSAEYAIIARQLYEENPESIRLVTRPFPVFAVNDKAGYAALVAEAAALQDKYWEMHDLLFARQADWVSLTPEAFYQWVTVQASALGIDTTQFAEDMKRAELIEKVNKAWDDGTKINLPGTPIVIINGDLYQGSRDYSSLNDVVQLMKLGERQYTSCPPVTINVNTQYLATLHTEKGDIVLELFAEKAPITVNSFIFLARNGWYDNITFHRVIPNIFAQTGDPSGSGKGNPGYYVITEILPTLTFNKPGVVAMVNSGPDTSGSQFFITYAPTAEYDGRYTIFGQVLKGMDVLRALTPRDAKPGVATPPGDKLLSVTIEEK
jgi:cyclophilin family peptidyl-prolyl cis-trans isomerase/protein-disulfide isomerase